MADFTKAIELDPESASAYSGRAWTKAYIDDLDGAIADLQQASVLAPDDISVHEEFSVYLRIRGEDRAFVKVMTRAVELGCDSAQGLGWLAWIQATSTDPEARNNTSALALAKRVVSRVPDSGEFQTTLGVALYRNGEWAEAREALQRSIDLGHKSRTSLLFIAMALKQMGQVDEARRRYDQAIALPTYLPPDEEEYQRFRAEAEALLD